MQDNFTVLTNKSLRLKLTELRECAARAEKRQIFDCDDYSRLMREIGIGLAYEAAKDLATEQRPVYTPYGKAVGTFLQSRPVVVPVLRSGLTLAEGFQTVLSNDMHTGYIGIHRDKNDLQRELLQYVIILPDPDPPDRLFIVLDPVIATGDTADQALNILKEHGATNISFMSLVVSQPAQDRLAKAHSDVRFYAVSIDEELDLDHPGRVRPGIGSVSGNLFGFRTTTEPSFSSPSLS